MYECISVNSSCLILTSLFPYLGLICFFFFICLCVHGIGYFLWLNLENEVKMESFLSPVWLSDCGLLSRYKNYARKKLFFLPILLWWIVYCISVSGFILFLFLFLEILIDFFVDNGFIEKLAFNNVLVCVLVCACPADRDWLYLRVDFSSMRGCLYKFEKLIEFDVFCIVFS